MGIRHALLRAIAAVFVLAACSGERRLTESAEAATPPLLWQDVRAVRVLCLVVGERGVDPSLQARICDRVRALAAVGAPVPVATLAQGDPALLAGDTVTLLVHGSVQPLGGRRVLAFAIRPFRNSADQAGLVFAAAPRAVELAGEESDHSLDEALSAALAETLPWLATARAARRIEP